MDITFKLFASLGDYLPSAVRPGNEMRLTVADGATSFTISLTIEQTSTLPEDTAGRGVIELPWALRITMPGFEEALLVGGPFQLAGRV